MGSSQEQKMADIIKITKALLVTSILGISLGALASEVYIDQAGSASTINLTQTGSSNIVNGDAGTTTAAVLNGSSQTVDITQTGNNNESIINIVGGTADLDQTATGDYNQFEIDVNGGTGNVTNVTTTGDYNRVTVCGTNDGTASSSSGTSVAGPDCSTGISANDVTNTISITGDANVVNTQVGSLANTTNTVTIGAVTASSNNIVNIDQSNTDANTVTLGIDGDGNNVSIVQD